MTINVTAVNDAPTGADKTITINEDATYTFAAADFGFSDVDSGDTLSAVRIDTQTLPAGATLKLSGNPVTNGQVILTADIPNLVFAPAANANGTGYASFTFSVRDSALVYDATPNTITFNVTALNDAPTADAQTVTTNEDTAKTITLSGTDPDGNALTFSIVTGPSHGSLGTIGIVGCSGTPSSCTANVTYTPGTNYNGFDSFTFKVNDGSADSAPATVSITVNAVNDAPVANDDTATTDEDTAGRPGQRARQRHRRRRRHAHCSPRSTNGAHGTVSETQRHPGRPATRSSTPRPPNYNGPDTFTYTASDGWPTRNTATVSITVTAVNDAPVAGDDTATTNEDTPVDDQRARQRHRRGPWRPP